MIEGIEVLNKIPIMDFSKNTEIIYSIVTISLVIIFIVPLVVAANCNSFLPAVLAILTTILFAAAFFLLEFCKEETGRYEYQCTISDTVNFKEMYEKYEIISKDGELWTIKDKECDEK